jgi:hypothetical protein
VRSFFEHLGVVSALPARHLYEGDIADRVKEVSMKKPMANGPMAKKSPTPALPKIDVEAVLRICQQIRDAVPKNNPYFYIEEHPRRPNDEGRVQGGSLEEFELRTALAAVRSLSEELSEAIERTDQQVYDECLRVYYVGLELLKQPDHDPNLATHLEEMQKGHINDFGKPIPPRAESEARGLIIPPVVPRAARPETPDETATEAPVAEEATKSK